MNLLSVGELFEIEQYSLSEQIIKLIMESLEMTEEKIEDINIEIRNSAMDRKKMEVSIFFLTSNKPLRGMASPIYLS